MSPGCSENISDGRYLCSIGSGLSVGVDVGDSTIIFELFGSTSSFAGTFNIVISNIDEIINSVTGGPLSLSSGSFALGSFGPHSITFTGTTTNGFNAIGGRSVTFNVAATPSVPEPATFTLLAFGLAGVGRRYWRQRQAS